MSLSMNRFMVQQQLLLPSSPEGFSTPSAQPRSSDGEHSELQEDASELFPLFQKHSLQALKSALMSSKPQFLHRYLVSVHHTFLQKVKPLGDSLSEG